MTLPPRRARESPAACCTQCEGEIYPGEDYYRVDGRAVCTDCLPRFAEHYFRLYRITGGATKSI